MKINSFWLSIIITILILTALGVGYYYGYGEDPMDGDKRGTVKVIEKVIGEIIPPTTVLDQTSIETSDFKNADHNISLKYPKDWQQTDLGGDKNVTDPFLRENIAYFYLPGTETDKKEPSTAIASVKLIRFVLDSETKISSLDDWYGYIKTQVDNYQNSQLEQNYKLENLDRTDDLDGKWTVVENYLENELVQGKDYYIYNEGQLYQFVTRAPKAYFDNYLPYIETIVKSIKFD